MRAALAFLGAQAVTGLRSYSLGASRSSDGAAWQGGASWQAGISTVRQELDNYMDVQYFANISVGGQQITGIIDTGSFELVVFEQHCQGCGLAGKYDKLKSNTSSLGPLEQRLYYGSGDIFVKQAFDMVSVGRFGVVNQTFWQGHDAHMPVLEYAKFQSIIGVGPPETPANDFWVKTADSIGKLKKTLGTGNIPPLTATRKVMDHLQASLEMSRHRTLLSQYRVGAFSLCLGKQPGSSGFFVWNDSAPFKFPSLFKRVQVIGRHTWTVNLTNVHLSSGSREMRWLGCSHGCGAVIDSGTSLLMIPSAVVDMLESAVVSFHADCRDLHSLPDFSFELDGHRFTLPPDAYLTELHGGSSSYAEGDVRARIRNLKLGKHCQLTVMESYSDTHWGPLWIIGMPFFRKYYTSFSIGRSRADRALYIAPSNAGCIPTSYAMSLTEDRFQEQHFTNRTVNASHMYLSPLVRRASSGEFLHL